MDIYSEIILDHYNNPRAKGVLRGANAIAEDANPLCGDKVRYYLKIGKSGVIKEVRFTGSGCAISQAAASMLAEEAAGKTANQVMKWENGKVTKLLGVKLTPARLKCALLGLAVLKGAISAFRGGKKSRLPHRNLRTFDESDPYYAGLNKIEDPDSGIGIADMGLIYGVSKTGGTVKVTMTLTSAGCPAASLFTKEIARTLKKGRGVREVLVEIVWEPPWTPDMIKPKLRSAFGL